METVMMDWLRQGIGLPDDFSGTIQESASAATLAAVLTMRERSLGWTGNTEGLKPHTQLRIYCSSEVHTSIDRAIWVSGIGSDNLVRIPIVGQRRGMDKDALRAAIEEDLKAGLQPAGVIACTGATGVGSCDNLSEILAIAQEYDLYCRFPCIQPA